MRTIIIIILSLTFFTLRAQTDETIVDKREFKSQGEQEDHWTKQFFEKNYKRQVFKKYTGGIVVKGNGFTYGGQTLVVNNTSKELTNIFSKGIFYPSIITGQTNSTIKSNEEPDTLSVEQKLLYNLTNTYSLTIGNLEELPFLSKIPTRKRYRFWLFRKGVLNPTVCFIELTNKDATKKTDRETFINGAVLTFYKTGWIVI